MTVKAPAAVPPAAPAPVTPSMAPPKSNAELESRHQQAHTARINKAMEAALAGKLDPPGAPPKGNRVAAPKARAAAPLPAGGAGVPVTVAAPGLSTAAPAGAPPAAQPAAPGVAPLDDSDDSGELPAAPDPAAAEESPETLRAQFERARAAGAKKDLRAIEAELGLEEGALGVSNGSYAAYRRRVEEVSAREAKHAENEGTLVGKFGPAVGLIQQARAGNLKAYAQLIEHTTGVAVPKFIEFFSKNVERLDPRITQLEQENAQLKRGTNQPQQPAGDPRANAIAKANEFITAEAGQHPAFQLAGAIDGVRDVWLKSWDAPSQSFRLTPAAAANEYVRERKAQHEREQWLLAGKKPPKGAARNRNVPRLGASETQPRKQAMTRQEAIEHHAKLITAAKNRERAGVS